MHRFLPPFCRVIATFLVMAVLTMGMAGAAYACPILAEELVQKTMVADASCAGMDDDHPVQCAEHQSGAQMALEHTASPPLLVPVALSTAIPAPAPDTFSSFVPSRFANPRYPESAPPYLRTLRLRI